MKALVHLFLIVGISVMAMPAASQVSTVLDGAYVKETNLTKRVVPYPALREADVMYVRRIWQDIDLRQKINQMFYYPVEPIQDRKNLFDVITYALQTEGSLTAYDRGPTLKGDDEFRFPMTAAMLDSALNPTVKSPVFDDDNRIIPGEFKEEPFPITSDQIKKYRIKEDWVWDRQRSQRHIRIIGLAPLIEVKDDNGNVVAENELFWLYYPECRYVFANAECYNYANDAQRRTFEEIFQKRYFSSYIIKETNVFDRSISDYAEGLDALLESERIKDELFTIEHDLWHY